MPLSSGSIPSDSTSRATKFLHLPRRFGEALRIFSSVGFPCAIAADDADDFAAFDFEETSFKAQNSSDDGGRRSTSEVGSQKTDVGCRGQRVGAITALFKTVAWSSESETATRPCHFRCDSLIADF